MAHDITVPDPSVVLDLMTAFRSSKVMFAAVSLGVFDALADGPKSAAALAERLNANPQALERLLNVCVGLKLLTRRCINNGQLTRDNGPITYENTPAASAYLTKSSPRRLTGYINNSNTAMWRLWANLEDAVREGT